MRRNVTCLLSRTAVRISDLNLTMAIHDGLSSIDMINQHRVTSDLRCDVMGLMRLNRVPPVVQLATIGAATTFRSATQTKSDT